MQQLEWDSVIKGSVTLVKRGVLNQKCGVQSNSRTINLLLHHLQYLL